MSLPSGSYLWPPRMRRHAAWSARAKAVRTKLRELPPPVKLACGLTLLVLMTLLAGCATPSPPVTPSSNPARPTLSEPLPEESYSSKAQRLIDSWLSPATGM